MRRAGRGMLRWLRRMTATTAAIVLSLALLPQVWSWLNDRLPELSGSTETISMVLSRHLEESSRLETSVVDDEGITTSRVDALIMGTVQTVTIRYRYQASIGIDLRRVSYSLEDGHLLMSLPPLEVLLDRITPISVDRKDFWYPLTERRRQKLLNDELLRCRTHYLEENSETEAAWENTVSVMHATLGSWLGEWMEGLQIEFVKQENLLQ